MEQIKLFYGVCAICGVALLTAWCSKHKEWVNQGRVGETAPSVTPDQRKIPKTPDYPGKPPEPASTKPGQESPNSLPNATSNEQGKIFTENTGELLNLNFKQQDIVPGYSCFCASNEVNDVETRWYIASEVQPPSLKLGIKEVQPVRLGNYRIRDASGNARVVNVWVLPFQI